MPTIERGGVHLFFDDAGSGLPVVFHTGGAGSSAMWRAGGYVERLSGFRRILFDHRGRGRSDRPTDPAAHRVSEYVDDVSALAEHLALERYAFFGYSFGGLIGLELAARDPRVAALVVLGTIFDPPDVEPTTSVYDEPVRVGGMETVVDTMERDEGLVLPGWLRDEFLSTDPRQFVLTIDVNATDPDPWNALETIRARTVLIAGGDEDPNDVQEVMARRIPNARSVHVAGVGHVGAFLRP
ncbi:MAG: alpha/beta hydrolase, partial [Actinomycetota bacterium]